MEDHKPATILIVEDHEAFRLALREWLEGVYPDSRVIEAGSGEEALTLIYTDRPRLVIMDLNLPGMNGLETTKRIKTGYPSADVVMLSIQEGNNYRAYALAAGASAYISKRSMLTALPQTLNALLSKVPV